MGKKMATAEKNLWITSISLAEVDGESYIPTALCYDQPSKPQVGSSAI
jgi:hypothetical protein